MINSFWISLPTFYVVCSWLSLNLVSNPCSCNEQISLTLYLFITINPSKSLPSNSRFQIRLSYFKIPSYPLPFYKLFIVICGHLIRLFGFVVCMVYVGMLFIAWNIYAVVRTLPLIFVVANTGELYRSQVRRCRISTVSFLPPVNRGDGFSAVCHNHLIKHLPSILTRYLCRIA